MRTCDFNKLKKEKNAQQIIGMHTHYKIKLTQKQLDELIEMKKEKKAMRKPTGQAKKIKLKTRINTLMMKLKGELND